MSFYKRFLVPIALILLSASTALIAGLYAMTHQQDARERDREEQVVALALAGQVDGLQKVLREYARWDDAAANVVTGFDAGWLDEQFGLYLYQSNGYEGNFIVDERGRTLYAAVHGRRTGKAAERDLGRAYGRALTTAAAQTAGKETAIGGLSVGAHGPLLFAVHRILPSPGSALPPGAPRRYMVVAKEVDEQLALDIRQAAQIAAPRLVAAVDPALAAVPVRTYGGTVIGHYAWAPTTPGTELRRSSMPILAGFVLVLLGLGTIVLRNAQSDLRELEASEAKAQHLARHDALTGLPNRRAFNERLVRLAGRDAVYTVLVIDLDGFKEVNDCFGHATGDLLLRRTSERLRRALPPHAYLARPGGDEFFVAWEHEAAIDHQAAATAIIEAVREPHEFQAEPILVGASVGIAEGAGLECADVVRRADVAMYAAKSRGRDNWCLYSPTLDDGRRERRELEGDLRRAIAAGEISVAFQPIVRSRSGQISGVEALARWSHPTRGAISPDLFIPIAEDSGAIVELGRFVLREACLRARDWPFLLSVNLSPAQFWDRMLVHDVLRTLDECGFPPERLEFEITETYLLRRPDAAEEVIRDLRRHGIKVALDDFGTGYASVGYLRRFEFDKVKLDRSFVEPVVSSPEAADVALAVVALGSALKIPILAEGVETEHHAAILSTAGCEFMQGWFYGMPQTAAEIDAVLANGANLAAPA